MARPNPSHEPHSAFPSAKGNATYAFQTRDHCAGLTRRYHHHRSGRMPSHARRARRATAVYHSRVSKRHTFSDAYTGNRSNTQANVNSHRNSYRDCHCGGRTRNQYCTGDRNESTRLNSRTKSHAYTYSATSCNLRTQGIHIHLRPGP